MLTLPSGQIVTLAAIPFDPPTDQDRAMLRRHLLASAEKNADLYPLYEVVRLESGMPAIPQSDLDNLALFSDSCTAEGLAPIRTGDSLIAFHERLESVDKDVFAKWVNSDAVDQWMTQQLLAIIAQRRRHDAPAMYPRRRRHRYTEATIAAAEPDDFAAESCKLFPNEASDWKSYASDAGYLRLRPSIYLYDAGVAGTLGLGNQPSLEDIDCWEGSKRAGVWDYYSFLAFIVVPSGSTGDRELVLYFPQNTFFYRTFEVVLRLPLLECTDVPKGYDSDDEQQRLQFEWEQVLATLRAQVGNASLEEQVWTVQDKHFTVRDPDE